jgi:hypothetical protein
MKTSRASRKPHSNNAVLVTCLVAAICASFAANTYAYTECPGLVVKRVFTDAGGNLLVGTDPAGNLNGFIAPSAPAFKTVVAIALSAKLSGSPVTIRYSNNGVSCGTASWGEPIEGIGM